MVTAVENPVPPVLPPHIREAYPFVARPLALPGGRMSYLDEGPVDGPVIIFVHGNPTWSFFYRSLVLRLRHRYRCIVPDHLGCGLSDKPGDFDYSLISHIENLGTLVDHLGVRSASLAVHDWGGPIGLGMARRRPDLVQKLVVLNTAAFPSTRIPVRIAVCRWPWLGALLVRGGNAFSAAALHMAVAHPLSRATRDAYLLPYRSWGERIAVHRFVRDIPLGPLDRSFGELEAIGESLAAFATRPVLIVWGLQDWCFDVTFLREWQHRFKHARIVQLADAGHWLLEDEPDAVGVAVESFLG
jgi:cis-3-alkyl-4-acyloxetan-2-one decarboxylase